MQIQIQDPRIVAPDLRPKTAGSAGIDLHACIHKIIQLWPGEQITIPVGIKIALDPGYVGQIHPRSGLGMKGLILANSTGIIDSDYRGEIAVRLWNRSQNENFLIHPMDRVAQLVIVQHYPHNCIEISTAALPETSRGEQGFGSTGVHSGVG